MRTSSVVTSSRPAQAASAIAALAVTRSARRPSTSKAAQTVVISRSAWSPSSTRGRRARASAIWAASAASSAAQRAANPLGVGLVRQAPAHDLGPLDRVAGGRHLDGEAEAVEQLRAQLALLGVHRPDEQEARGVHDRDALALDVGPAEGGGVEQQVDQVVVQQVDLVDVEHAAVGCGQQPGLVRRDAGRERALQVQRPDEAVLGGADRQLDEAGRTRAGRERGVRAVRALRVRRGGVAGEAAALHDRDRRQQRGERAHDGRLGGALLAADEDTPDGRRDGVDDEREAQVVQPDDGGERVGAHGVCLSRVMEPFLEVRAPDGGVDGGSVWLPESPRVTVAGPRRTLTGFLSSRRWLPEDSRRVPPP